MEVKNSMEWIILTSVLALFLSGYYIMVRLDRFIASARFFPDTETFVLNKNEQCEALVFGRFDISAEIYKLLEKENIRFIKADTISEFDQSQTYEFLFAVDKDDLENLMVCSICEKLKPEIKKIATLNKIENKNVYDKYHIPFIYTGNLTALQIATELFPYMKR